MKKADRRKKGPSRASLREMPEVDFKAAKVRRNPFAKRIAAEGIVHNQHEKPKVRRHGARTSLKPSGA